MIARVFPRKTRATPTDDLAFFGPPGLFPPRVDEVHVSVTFTWDLPQAEWLANQWEGIAPVKIGGPGTRMRGGEFEPGKYLEEGYTITSRGCPNRCWFCSVWRRDGNVRELPIRDGWNILDDNLLACSETHIRSVFSMLKKQSHKAEFTGGLEAARLQSWHVDLLLDLKPRQFFFAYDTPDDYEPLRVAATMLTEAGFERHTMRCFVLIGYENDTMTEAGRRLRQTLDLGFFPMAMLWRGENGTVSYDWKRFQRQWARPALMYRACVQVGREE